MNDLTATVDAFEPTYRNHVAMVVAGDLAGVMADMNPETLAHVFDGVTVPRGAVASAEVVRIEVAGGRATGEAVYETVDGAIGLRSGWAHDGSAWKADRLENFAPPRDGS